jgi:hypothetical protein
VRKVSNTPRHREIKRTQRLVLEEEDAVVGTMGGGRDLNSS